tara:strand:- start:117 stop:770 length:654 start_codon:yes stop_codon:yes gene_type:complete
MYFSLIPDIKYDVKPISYPFSESDFITAKNFFRRYQIDPDVFEYSTFYTKYSVQDNDRIENIAASYYGDSFYDWVIILTNNFINPLFAFPSDSETLRKSTELKYGFDNAYSGIHHYVTKEIKVGDLLALEGGLIVDQNFYSSSYEYWNGSQVVSVPGNTVSSSVTNYDYEIEQNEKKRNIYILKSNYFSRFVEEFKTKSLYQESSSFISKRLKQSGI